MQSNLTNSDIRRELASKLVRGEFVTDKSGVKTIEVIGRTFIANEDRLFGVPNQDYIARELAWYESQSLNVNDIPEPVPAIWKAVATPDGRINSNYGWMIYSSSNGYQYKNVLEILKKDRLSRRAEMIYTRPTMHTSYNAGGMSDFVCTEAVQYLIRNDKLNAIVKMRSNDAWAGYRNDYAWQMHVLKKLASDLGDIEIGNMYWSAGSLHVYSKQFYLVDHFAKTGETSISKEDYDKLYLSSY